MAVYKGGEGYVKTYAFSCVYAMDNRNQLTNTTRGNEDAYVQVDTTNSIHIFKLITSGWSGTFYYTIDIDTVTNQIYGSNKEGWM